MSDKKKELPLWKKINKPFASLKLGVVIILAIGTMSAWGTIVESMFNDARRAQILVYHSWYSYSIFGALAVCLIAVMIDRWPWKPRHIGFLLAHVGILILMAGSLMTFYFGVDGQMAIDIGKQKKQIMIPGMTDLVVYSSLGTGGYRTLYNEPVDFISNPPSPEKPYTLEIPNNNIIIDKYNPYSVPQVKVTKSSAPGDGPGLRFQIANERVKETQWLALGNRPMEALPLGPAQVILAKKDYFKYNGGNILLLEFSGESPVLSYKVFTQRLKKMTAHGTVEAGGSIETGWMGLTFRLLKYLPKAREEYSFKPLARGGEGVIPSVRVQFQGKELWLGLNSTIKLFTDNAVYYLGFVNRLIELDFNIRLKKFDIGRYQGTRRAATYASDVMVIGKDGQKLGPIHIAMNEPLKHKGFTFYQASFAENENGQPTTSVLSVNRDPGRPWKYLGSLLIVLGAIHMFYFNKPRRKRKT